MSLDKYYGSCYGGRKGVMYNMYVVKYKRGSFYVDKHTSSLNIDDAKRFNDKNEAIAVLGNEKGSVLKVEVVHENQ
jgi:hypothetical protein